MIQTYSDQQIIDAFCAGGIARQRAWEYVYKSWRDKVIGFIIGKNGTREEAIEAVQDVAIPFEKRICRPDFVLQNQLATYFTACVYYRWLRIRKAAKSATAEWPEQPVADFVHDMEADIAHGDLASLLDETLSRIGERCKTILRYFMEGYSMKELAEKMGFPGGEQVAKNEKRKCQLKYETFLNENPGIKAYLQQLRNG